MNPNWLFHLNTSFSFLKSRRNVACVIACLLQPVRVLYVPSVCWDSQRHFSYSVSCTFTDWGWARDTGSYLLAFQVTQLRHSVRNQHTSIRSQFSVLLGVLLFLYCWGLNPEPYTCWTSASSLSYISSPHVHLHSGPVFFTFGTARPNHSICFSFSFRELVKVRFHFKWTHTLLFIRVCVIVEYTS